MQQAFPFLMSQVSNLFVRRVGLFIITLSLFFTQRGEATPGLKGPIRQGGSLELTINGSKGEAVVLQASRDLKAWNDLQTYYLSTDPAVYQQTAGANQWNFFRLKSGTAATGTQLPPLSDSANAVFVAGEGFDTVQFAPNGIPRAAGRNRW